MPTPTPTIPDDPNTEPVLTLTLVLPLGEAARIAAFAASRSLSIEAVIDALISLARLGEDGSLSMGRYVIGQAAYPPQIPRWATDALADPTVMSGQHAYPLMVLPGCHSTDHTRPPTPPSEP